MEAWDGGELKRRDRFAGREALARAVAEREPRDARQQAAGGYRSQDSQTRGYVKAGLAGSLAAATATLAGVRFAIGEVVVYPAYGVGRISILEQRLVLGVKKEILVLELAEGLSVTLPVDLADDLLRPLLSEADIVQVQETLREDQALSGDGWLKRQKDVRAKVVGGDPSELADVVRNGARRDRGLKAKGTGSQLSPSERDLYLRARRLLSSEIAWARGLDPDEADDWIEAQLGARAS